MLNGSSGGLDTDGDTDPLTAALVSGPTNGTLIGNLATGGAFVYEPNPDFSGVDSFTYYANDGSSNSNLATASITVNGLNDAPQAVDDGYSTDEDVALVVDAPGVLENDSDGVVVDTLGISGTRASNHLKWDEAMWSDQVKHREGSGAPEALAERADAVFAAPPGSELGALVRLSGLVTERPLRAGQSLRMLRNKRQDNPRKKHGNIPL